MKLKELLEVIQAFMEVVRIADYGLELVERSLFICSNTEVR